MGSKAQHKFKCSVYVTEGKKGGNLMNRSILILLFVCIILAGCTKPTGSNEGVITEIQGNEDTEVEIESIDKGIDTDIDSVITEEVDKEGKSDGEIKAENDAQALLQIIKEKDAVKLLQFLNTTRLDLEGSKKIIEGFDVNFDLDTLSAQIYYDGYRMDIEGGQYEFILLDKNSNEMNEERSLVIRYEEDGSIAYHNPYVQYFPYAENMLLRYLELINKESVTELARFLNADDIVVPDSVAEQTIKNYKEFFNSENLSVRYIDQFVFMIEDGKGKEHEIEVIYGDGLMSIKDDFIPDFQH